MLLILTREEDTTVTWFEQTYLSQSSIPWRRFNTELYPRDVGLDVIGSEGRTSNLPAGDISSADIRAVWYRRPTTWKSDPVALTGTSAYVASETEGFLRAFYACFDAAFWVNDPSRNVEAAEKTRQLRKARDAGFRVPDTVVTASPEVAETLARRHGDSVIVKPVKHGGVIVDGEERGFYTSLLNVESIRMHAASIRRCPLIFQEPIPKAFELRVTVVGDRSFAVRLDSQEVAAASIDWRKSPYRVRHTAFDLPREISDRCVRITRESGLRFAAFDIIVTPGDDYVFLEYNPNGQFAWLEEMTGIPIGGALLDLFAQAVK